jgi:hypothetical protein
MWRPSITPVCIESMDGREKPGHDHFWIRVRKFESRQIAILRSLQTDSGRPSEIGTQNSAQGAPFATIESAFFS